MMVWNECKRIWNIKSFLLVLLTGAILFYGWVMSQMDLLPYERVQAEAGKELMERDSVSLLPAALRSNINFTLQNFANMILLLTVLLIVPYIMQENRSRIYPVVAATKVGRGILRKQIGAVLLSTTALYGVCALIFLAAYETRAPYSAFSGCDVTLLWFDMTLREYVAAQLVFLFISAIIIALFCVFATAFCRTVIGMVVAAIPCIVLAEWLVVSFFGYTVFRLPDGRYTFYEKLYNSTPWNTPLFFVVLMAAAVLLILGLYRKRRREDVL